MFFNKQISENEYLEHDNIGIIVLKENNIIKEELTFSDNRSNIS